MVSNKSSVDFRTFANLARLSSELLYPTAKRSTLCKFFDVKSSASSKDFLLNHSIGVASILRLAQVCMM